MENKNNQGFSYTYSAREQAEIRKIREKYDKAQDSPDHAAAKMERLRRLDAGVARKAAVVALTLGILGTLILGCGMSLIMTDLGPQLGLDPTLTMPLSLAIGLAGILLLSLAYPVHQLLIKWERKRIAPEILRLTDELMK